MKRVEMDNGSILTVGNLLEIEPNENKHLVQLKFAMLDLCNPNLRASKSKANIMEGVIYNLKNNFIPFSWFLPSVPSDFDEVMGNPSWVVGSPDALAHAPVVRAGAAWARDVAEILERHADELEGLSGGAK